MQKLLAIEWLKLKNYRTFWILLLLYTVLLFLVNYKLAGTASSFNMNGLQILAKSYTFPDIWSTIAYIGSYFIIFLAILVIIITTNEYTFKTNRQNIIDGWQRVDFLHAKIGVVVTISVVATLYYFILCSIIGIVNGGAVTDLLKNTEMALYFFLLSINYLGFALVIALWIKRSGLAISLFLLYAMIIENIANLITGFKYSLFLPLQCSDELVAPSAQKMLQNMAGIGHTTPPSYYIIATVSWCVVYYTLSRIMLLRRDW